jgi:hypothetical protein
MSKLSIRHSNRARPANALLGLVDPFEAIRARPLKKNDGSLTANGFQ